MGNEKKNIWWLNFMNRSSIWRPVQWQQHICLICGRISMTNKFNHKFAYLSSLPVSFFSCISWRVVDCSTAKKLQTKSECSLIDFNVGLSWSAVSFILGDIKCPSMKKLRFWGPKLSWRATNWHKEVAKRGFLKTLSLEHCRSRCSSRILCDTVQLCHITTGWRNATFVWLIFTFWHVFAITCSVTVGLEYVTEIQVIGQSPRYHCELCDSKFDHNLKFPHLVGSKHRFNVLVSNVDLWNSKWNCFGSNVLINMESLLKLLSGSRKWWFGQSNHYFVRDTSSDKKYE